MRSKKWRGKLIFLKTQCKVKLKTEGAFEVVLKITVAQLNEKTYKKYDKLY